MLLCCLKTSYNLCVSCKIFNGYMYTRARNFCKRQH
nr:MAG TPA: hypothetical protein [Caudoviricetes sp.]